MTGKKRIAAFIILAFAAVLCLLPLVITITNSLMQEAEILQNYATRPDAFDLISGVGERFQRFALIPARVTFSQYYDILLRQPSFILLMLNSLKIAVPVTVGGLVIAVLSAYGFTVWQWRYKEILFQVYIVVMLMPLQAVLVPNYIVADMLHINESYLAIILPGVFSPFGVFLMRQALSAIPPAYYEAAKVDGAGDLYIFCNIVIPQIKSAAAALCMLTFIEYWNVVEQAVVFIRDYTREPLSVYLSRIAAGKTGLVFAASCLYMFLPLWFLAIGQENLEKGIELSGVKG